MAKTFTLLFPAQSGVTANCNLVSGHYDLVSRTDGKSPGLWCPLSGTYTSLWAEIDFMFSGPVPNPCSLMVKAGSFALKIVDGKIYLDSVTSASDVAAAYSISSDKEAGSTTIKPNVRYKVRFSYDHATSLVLVTLNGYEEIKFYRIRQPSSIGMTSDKLTVLEKVTGVSLYSLTVGNDRPAYRGMRCVARNGRIFLDRIDPTFLGKEYRVFVESPYGVITECPDAAFGGLDMRAKSLPLDPGTNSVTVQCGTFQQTLLIQSGYDPVMPTEFFTGFYNVRNTDMALAKANGATVTDSDWVQQRTVPVGVPNTPQNRLKLYADAALAAGMGLIPVCNIHNGKDEALLPEFANHAGIHSLILGDEMYGNWQRFQESFHAIRTQTKKAVGGSLNKPNLLPQMSMCSNHCYLNIYGTGPDIVKKINELADYAARWDYPICIVIASYGNVPSTPSDLTAQISACKAHPNIIGCLVFEWSHQETAGGPGWYLPDHPELLTPISQTFQP